MIEGEINSVEIDITISTTKEHVHERLDSIKDARAFLWELTHSDEPRLPTCGIVVSVEGEDYSEYFFSRRERDEWVDGFKTAMRLLGNEKAVTFKRKVMK